MPDRHHLVFGKDGTLRFAFDFFDAEKFDAEKNGWQQALIPVVEAERVFEHSLFLPALHGSVEVEAETTVRAVMNALRPWSAPFSDMLGRDVLAFINEAMRPVSMAKREEAIVSIIVSASLSFESRVKYLDDLGENFRVMSETRTYVPPKFQPLNEIDVTVAWRAAASEADSPFAVFLASLPVFSYAHVPVLIEKHVAISDKTQMIPERMLTREPLLNGGSPLVEDRPWGKYAGRHLGAKGHYKPDFVEFACAFLTEVCRFATPQRRDEHFAENAKRQAINTALDRQEGKENSKFARNPFEAAYEGGDRTTRETLDLVKRATANGATPIVRKQEVD